MKYNISKTGLELTEIDLELIQKKCQQLDKLADEHGIADIRFQRGNHHIKGKVVTCALNVSQGKEVLHAERHGENVQDVFDAALTALKQQLKKVRDKKANTR